MTPILSYPEKLNKNKLAVLNFVASVASGKTIYY
jgi:hypothetical protein